MKLFWPFDARSDDKGPRRIHIGSERWIERGTRQRKYIKQEMNPKREKRLLERQNLAIVAGNKKEELEEWRRNAEKSEWDAMPVGTTAVNGLTALVVLLLFISFLFFFSFLMLLLWFRMNVRAYRDGRTRWAWGGGCARQLGNRHPFGLSWVWRNNLRY